MKRLIPSLVLAALVVAAPALAQQPGAAPAPAGAQPSAQDFAARIEQVESPQVAAKLALGFRARGDQANEILAWARAVKLRPHLGSYKLELAATYALQDRKREAYNALLELQSQGYAFDIAKDPRFEKVSTTEVWTYVVQGFDSNRARFGEVDVAYEIPKQHELIESLAWDPSRKQLLVGSARDGKVYRVEKGNKLVPLVSADADNGMWAVFDVAVDAERGFLWVASTAVPHYSGYNAETDLGRAGVFKFDLKTGRFLKKFLSPSIMGQAFFLSTLAIGPDGAVYAADGVNNAVYQVKDDEFRRLFHAPRLTSIRGMAVSGDNKSLFLGDHERGLIGYDLSSGKPFDIGVAKTLTLGGLEGVSWWDGHLIVVQNSMNPARVMRLKLADGHRSVVAVHPIAANIDAMTVPTLGTLDGATYYFLANSQKSRYDRFGLAHDKSKLEPSRILRAKVDAKQAEAPAKPTIVGGAD
jgi:hypothetical protein